MAKFVATTAVYDEAGRAVWFAPGEEVPEWVAAKADSLNPAIFDEVPEWVAAKADSLNPAIFDEVPEPATAEVETPVQEEPATEEPKAGKQSGKKSKK